MKKVIFVLIAAMVILAGCGYELKQKGQEEKKETSIIYIVGVGAFEAENSAISIGPTNGVLKFTDITGREVTWNGTYLKTDTPLPASASQDNTGQGAAPNEQKGNVDPPVGKEGK